MLYSELYIFCAIDHEEDMDRSTSCLAIDEVVKTGSGKWMSLSTPAVGGELLSLGSLRPSGLGLAVYLRF